MGRLAGKHALVTGGTQGIGEAIVRQFVAEGARVIAASRSADKGRALEAELGPAVTYRVLDVADEQAWNALAAEFANDPINVLVNNAGRLHYPKLLHELSLAEWRLEIDVNLTGAFLGMRAFIPMMLAHGGGSIINISSISGVRGQPDATGYQASKAGLRWLTKQAAMAYATQGIRANNVNPGLIVTPLFETSPQERLQFFHRRLPMQRVGQPIEVAHAVVFLASDEAAYVTGIDLAVDGGLAV